MTVFELEEMALDDYVNRFGDRADQPAGGIEVRDVDGQEYVVLSNINGPLAAYVVAGDELVYVDLEILEPI